MTSNSSTSRIAIAIITVLVALVIIWIVLPGIQKGGLLNVMKSASDQPKTNVPESKPELKSDVKPVMNETQSKMAESEDFRVSDEDQFASVPDDRFFTTSGVTGLIPDGEVTAFRIGQRVYAYAAIHAPRQETVRITWFDSVNHEILPSAYLDVETNTGKVGYRVYTYRTFRKPGAYWVQLSNGAGVVIGKSEFKIIE
jgi:hypothetical protein